MTDRAADLKRLVQLLRLAAKEDHHLQAVSGRFMPEGAALDREWLEAALANDIGIDRLESFSAKFSRMQDTVIDKLLPQLLRAAGETPLAAIDNLNRAERLGFIADSNRWLEMRRIRNRLVHEYIESLDEMVPALQAAKGFASELHSALRAMVEYARDHLGVNGRE